MAKSPLTSVDQYIATQPQAVQATLHQVRAIILKAAPKLEEGIKWGMPAFMLKGKNMVLFAAFKKHIGLFPGLDTQIAFKKELAGYKVGKGSIQLPLDKSMPITLITKMVKYRVKAAKAK